MPTVVALSTPSEVLEKARAPYDRTGSELFLSLAVYDDLGVEDVAVITGAVASDFAPLRIRVHGIGTFMGEHYVLYAAALMAPELAELHRVLHRELHLVGPSRPNYLPGRWVPHITLATVSTAAKAASAYTQLLEVPVTGQYPARELVVVSGPPPTVEERYQLNGVTY